MVNISERVRTVRHGDVNKLTMPTAEMLKNIACALAYNLQDPLVKKLVDVFFDTIDSDLNEVLTRSINS